MTLPEALETTRIHSFASFTGDRTAWVTTRPCRAPYQTISDAGLIGGGHVSSRSCANRWRRVSYTYNFAGVIHFHAFADLAIRLLTATGSGEAREPSCGSAR
jgi:hypothetical protein